MKLSYLGCLHVDTDFKESGLSLVFNFSNENNTFCVSRCGIAFDRMYALKPKNPE